MIVAPYLSLKAPKASVFLRFSFNTQGHHRFNPIDRRRPSAFLLMAGKHAHTAFFLN